MVNPEIRKLQFLNDLIAQTLEVVNQRGITGMTGLSHTPFADCGTPYCYPTTMPTTAYNYNTAWPTYNPTCNVPTMNAGYNMVNPLFSGMFHTPYTTPYTWPMTRGYYDTPVTPGWDPRWNTPFVAPWTNGLNHTRWNTPMGIPYCW